MRMLSMCVKTDAYSQGAHQFLTRMLRVRRKVGAWASGIQYFFLALFYVPKTAKILKNRY
jgi:hypothetical protein